MKATQSFTVRPALPDELAGLARLAGNLRWSWHRRTRDLFAWADPPAWAASGSDPVATLGLIEPGAPGRAGRRRPFLAALAAAERDLDDYLNEPRWFQAARLAGGTRRCAASPTSRPSSASPRRSPSTRAAWACWPATTSRPPPTWACRWSASGCSTATATSARPSPSTAGSRSATPTSTPGRMALRLCAGHRQPSSWPASPPWPASGGPTWAGCRSTCSTPTSTPTRPTCARSPTASTAATPSTGCARRSCSAWAACGRCGRWARPRSCSTPTRATPASSASSASATAIAEGGLSYPEAIEAARAGCLFTTHTPVPAGIDRFPRELIERYFSGWAAECGVTIDDLMALGHRPGDDPDERFNMAVMGLRLAARSNGVSAPARRGQPGHVRRPLAGRARARGADRLGHQRRARQHLDVGRDRRAADQVGRAGLGRRRARGVGARRRASRPARSGRPAARASSG